MNLNDTVLAAILPGVDDVVTAVLIGAFVAGYLVWREFEYKKRQQNRPHWK